jgi:hypothetical protein
MVSASVLALGPVPATEDVGQQVKRARASPNTQTEDGARRVEAEKKRRQRAQKRARDLDENDH